MSSGSPNPDPLEVVRKLAESHLQIRFGKGVVGKTSHATLALLGVWAIVLFRLSENLWLDAALLGGALTASGWYAWWVSSTQRFARENPGLALMEGSELLEYQKFEAAKGLVAPPASPVLPGGSRAEDQPGG